MIYTLGYAEAYEGFFRTQAQPRKLGRYPGYAGGSVWRTRAEVQAYIDARKPGYAVYGVQADWEHDTAPHPEQPFHDLLVDADLVRLPPPEPGLIPDPGAD